MALIDRLASRFSPASAVRLGEKLMSQGKPKEAFAQFSRAAQAGNRDGEYRVGRCYLESTGVPPNLRQATRWLEKAGQQGHIEAQVLLARLNLVESGDRSDARVAAGLFHAAAPAKANYPEAMKWARMAADGGHADAQSLLAFILTNGPEGSRNQAEADSWYKRAAEGDSGPGHLGHALALARDKIGRAHV